MEDIIEVEESSQIYIKGSAYLLACLLALRDYDSFFREIKRRYAFLGLLVFIPFSAAWSLYPGKVFVNWVHFLGLGISIMVASRYFARYPERFLAMLAYGLGFSVVYAMGASLLLPEVAMSGDAWRGSQSNPNTLGVICFAALWANIAYLMRGIDVWQKMAVVGLIGVSVVTLYFTDSKTSAVAAAFVAVSFPVVLSLSRHDLGVKAVLAGIWIWFGLMVLMAIWLFAPGLLGFEGVVTAMGKDASLSGRTELWADAFGLIKASPVVGWSFDSLLTVNEYSAVLYSHFHNGYLNVLITGGVVTFLLVAGIVVSVIINVRRLSASDTHLRISSMIFVLAFLLHNMTEVSFLASPNPMWIIILFMYFHYGYLVYQIRRLGRRSRRRRKSRIVVSPSATTVSPASG